jgi:hypothetical protein
MDEGPHTSLPKPGLVRPLNPHGRIIDMKRTLMAAAATISLFVAAPAFAHPTVCNITDNYGNALVYSFVDNTYNANGTYGGTVVEDGFMKNGRVTVSPVGNRPVWVYGGNQGGGFNIYSREAPGWSIRSANGQAILQHNSRVVGVGTCGGRANYATSGTVGDQGYVN